jgi:hypothetical protein
MVLLTLRASGDKAITQLRVAPLGISGMLALPT